MFSKKFRTLALPSLLFFSFALLYIHNLSSSVYGGDVGDFVTSASVGGVAHAPGYPLFIIVGFLLIHLLPFFTPAFAMGLLSACAGAAGIVICYLIVKQLTKSNLSAVVTAITLGASYLYWFYSEIAEVFAVHSFLILSLFYFAILFDQTRKKKWLYWWAFVLGIASVTHQTIVLFIPSYLLIISPTLKKTKKESRTTRKLSLRKVLFSFRNKLPSLRKQITKIRKYHVHITKEHIKTVLITAGLFILPWFSYLYVFIASSHNPVINWDNVHDLHSFLQLILRKDYGTFTAGLFPQPIFTQRLIVLKSYLFTILTQVTIPVITISIIGLITLWFYSRRYVVAFLLAFLLVGPLFISYAGFPLAASFYFGVYERFFTMSTLPIFLLFGYGIFSLGKYFAGFFDRPVYFVLLHILLLLIPLQLFVFNFPKTNLSQVWVGDTLSEDFLNPLPQNAVLLMSGDTQLFDTWYMHYAKHLRPDVKLINLSLISSDPLVKKEEDLVKKDKPHVESTELVALALQKIAQKMPVYSLQAVESPGSEHLTWVPTGMVYKLSLATEKEDKNIFLKDVQHTLHQIHFPFSQGKNYRNLTISDIPLAYASALWAVGNYLQVNYGDEDTALIYYRKALTIDPTFENAYTTIGIIYLTKNTNCLLAEKNFKEVIAQQPYGELPYFLLYTTYTECLHNKNEALVVVDNFKKEFKKDFFSELALTLKSFKK